MADKSPSKPKTMSTKLDMASIGGVVVGVGGVLGGLLLEGGKVTDVAQVTAAMIVLGGTIGAVMITTPLTVLWRGFKQFRMIFFEKVAAPDSVLEEIIGYAVKARKNSIISLEEELDRIPDLFLRKALSLAVDGTDTQELRKMMELEIAQFERGGQDEAKVYEAAGGYAPTIGIIGAVLGLIQVMKDLANIDRVGAGIAVAFVATVYGVASANLFFLPAANKLKARVQRDIQVKEMTLEGVIGIVEGMNPKLIRVKLEAFLQGEATKQSKKNEGKGKAPVAQAASAAQ